MNENLREKLDEIAARYDELAAQMSSGEARLDMGRLSKELGSLGPMVEQYRAYKVLETGVEEARAILDDPDADADLRELAEAELEENEGALQAAEADLMKLFVSEDADANRNVIVEIRAGTGGEEAALFAGDLFRMYLRYAEKQHWKVEMLGASESGLDGYREVTFGISGQSVFKKLRYESGGHRVQRVPVTETQGRIHTSAATVAVLPEVEDVDVELNPDDIRMDFFRSSGPGGQSVNKTSSAVRLTHEPTGTVVSCQDEKSQHKNRAKAMRILRSRVYEKVRAEQEQARVANRKSLIGSGDRSERVRTYNFPQNRVTDHRINLTLYNLDNIIMGDLDEIVDALMVYDVELRTQEFLQG